MSRDEALSKPGTVPGESILLDHLGIAEEFQVPCVAARWAPPAPDAGGVRRLGGAQGGNVDYCCPNTISLGSAARRRRQSSVIACLHTCICFVGDIALSHPLGCGSGMKRLKDGFAHFLKYPWCSQRRLVKKLQRIRQPRPQKGPPNVCALFVCLALVN